MAYTSQNGYTVIDSISDCKKHSLPNGTTLYLRRGSVGFVLQHFVRRFHHRVESLYPTDCHSYSRRRIAGSGDWSNHASATAVDLNATRHPYGRRGTFTTGELSALRELLSEYDDVIRWGGDYRSTKDEMHFEIDKNQTAVNDLASMLRKDNAVSLDRLKPGKRNTDVLMVKRRLNQRFHFNGQMTKYFGRGFRDDYAAWQRNLGYTGADADGIPGRASLEALGFRVR